MKPRKDLGLEEPVREQVMGLLLGMSRRVGRVEGMDIEPEGLTEGRSGEEGGEGGEEVGARGEDGGESRMGGRGEGGVGSEEEGRLGGWEVQIWGG